MRDLLMAAPVNRQHLTCDIFQADGSISPYTSEVLTSEPDAARVLAFLKSYRWLRDEMPASIIRQTEYLEGKAGPSGITGWHVLAFQSDKSFGDVFNAAGQDFNCRKRSRTKTLRFGAYSEPNHRAIAAYLAGTDNNRSVRNPNTAMATMKEPTRAILVFYPVRQEITEPVTIGFGLLFPKNSLAVQLRFSVRDLRQPNAITVPLAP
jgi:hypothetical protein